MDVMGNKREIQAFLKIQKDPWEMLTGWKKMRLGEG